MFEIREVEVDAIRCRDPTLKNYDMEEVKAMAQALAKECNTLRYLRFSWQARETHSGSDSGSTSQDPRITLTTPHSIGR